MIMLLCCLYCWCCGIWLSFNNSCFAISASDIDDDNASLLFILLVLRHMVFVLQFLLYYFNFQALFHASVFIDDNVAFGLCCCCCGIWLLLYSRCSAIFTALLLYYFADLHHYAIFFVDTFLGKKQTNGVWNFSIKTKKRNRRGNPLARCKLSVKKKTYVSCINTTN